ncbi:DUF5133 domain-containing protein [Streptomyces sp. NPDC091292]|uniref:DUF5133 domain-containing protein n=1 Tax=Streptomyces sp. NPDC091292 TaxID=3365991 RepID=UPI003826E151
MLLPDKPQVAGLLERYRVWERLTLANPSNKAARGRFEDTAYTLCVLMGQQDGREAVLAAERYLRVRTGRCTVSDALG